MSSVGPLWLSQSVCESAPSATRITLGRVWCSGVTARTAGVSSSYRYRRIATATSSTFLVVMMGTGPVNADGTYGPYQKVADPVDSLVSNGYQHLDGFASTAAFETSDGWTFVATPELRFMDFMAPIRGSDYDSRYSIADRLTLGVTLRDSSDLRLPPNYSTYRVVLGQTGKLRGTLSQVPSRENGFASEIENSTVCGVDYRPTSQSPDATGRNIAEIKIFIPKACFNGKIVSSWWFATDHDFYDRWLLENDNTHSSARSPQPIIAAPAPSIPVVRVTRKGFKVTPSKEQVEGKTATFLNYELQVRRVGSRGWHTVTWNVPSDGLSAYVRAPKKKSKTRYVLKLRAALDYTTQAPKGAFTKSVVRIPAKKRA